MSALFRIVYATHANGTHHKLALDSLNEMQRSDRGGWTRLFLKHVKRYLEGSKAPDNTFKDFKNHVLHVSENYWGGAPETAVEWYGKTVAALKAQTWEEAVYAAGVLSHYYTDPIMPFHTGQTEAENAIHRATEWSINRSYNTLRAMGEERYAGLQVPVPTGVDWLSHFVCDGAEYSHRYYEKLIAHYDIHKGTVRPEDGLDPIAQNIVAELLIYAAKGFGHVLDAAIAESGVSAPDVTLTAETFLAAAEIPQKFIEKRLANAEDRKLVQAIYDELKATGRVEKALPEDDRVIRDLHRTEVLAPKMAARRDARAQRVTAKSMPQTRRASPPAVMPLQPAVAETDTTALELAVAKSAITKKDVVEQPPSLPGRNTQGPALRAVPVSTSRTQAELASDPAQGDVRRAYLLESDELVAAPSIGPKTADRFARHNIRTVSEFLARDPEELIDLLDDARIDAETIGNWQDQARLVIEVPGLRGTHAQLLVGSGYRSAQAIADADPVSLSVNVLKFAGTSEGRRVLREGRPPDIEKIKDWVEFAKTAVAA